MIAAFLELHLFVQIALAIGVLCVAGLAIVLAWAWWWPLNPDYQCECCADDAPPCLKEMSHE